MIVYIKYTCKHFLKAITMQSTKLGPCISRTKQCCLYISSTCTCEYSLKFCSDGIQKVHTCEDDQSVTLLSVPDLAASEQHVIQIQRVALPLPQHRSCELIQAVVGLLTLDQSFRREEGHGEDFILGRKVKTIP